MHGVVTRLIYQQCFALLRHEGPSFLPYPKLEVARVSENRPLLNLGKTGRREDRVPSIRSISLGAWLVTCLAFALFESCPKFKFV